MTTAKAPADAAAKPAPQPKTAIAKTAAAKPAASAKPAAEKAPAAKKPAAPKAAAPKPAATPKVAAPVAAPVAEVVVPAPVPAVAPAPVAKPAPTAKPVTAPVEAAQKAQTEALKSYEDAVAQTKDNLEAVVKASQTLAHGLQDLSKSAFGLAQEAVHDSVAAAKQLAAAKSLREAVDLQTTHAKAQLDRLLTEGAKLSEATAKLVEEAYAPVQARVHAALEKLTKRP